LFAHAGGIQAIAANGPMSLQAHTDQLEILADKEVTVISVNDRIEIKAKEKIVLQAGESAITLEGGDITFTCPGKFSVKGGKHQFDKGENSPARLGSLPDSNADLFDEAFTIIDKATGTPLSNIDYRIKRQDGTFEYGKTDDKGLTHIVRSNTEEDLAIEVKE